MIQNLKLFHNIWVPHRCSSCISELHIHTAVTAMKTVCAHCSLYNFANDWDLSEIWILTWTRLYYYCNVAVRKRMQLIQDSAARLVCSVPAHSYAAPLLHCLHWLPVHRRITYKLCVLMFDVYHGTAPKYLTDLCSRCNDHRLWSSTRGDFVLQRTKTCLADSSFTTAGPAAWNSLPARIRSTNSHDSFCRELKTYLFSLPV